ncbi:MAG: AraC family transcriptional regulator [Chitinivibrionales bacterium]|nr:AraC family transcriptional regulator [Chitinivibrionales bacterium]
MLTIPHITPGSYIQRSFYFPRRAIPLHALISSCGYSREQSSSYDWHGLRRGQAEFVLLQYTLDGAGRLAFEGADYRIEPGQAMLLHFPHDNRYYLPPESTYWEFVYVCLYGSYVTAVWRELQRRVGPVVALDPAGAIVEHTAAIVTAAASDTITTPYAASSLAYRLAMLLADRFLTPSPADEIPPPIARAVRFCRENLGQAITVDDMASQAGYSRYHFSRLFRDAVGRWPGEYLRDQRIRRAATLLQSTDLAVKQIAQQCGFYDATYFCKVFRKAIGMSPKAFRTSGMYGGAR